MSCWSPWPIKLLVSALAVAIAGSIGSKMAVTLPGAIAPKEAAEVNADASQRAVAKAGVSHKVRHGVTEITGIN